jgi:hypothetical protein
MPHTYNPNATVEEIAANLQPIIERRMEYLSHVRNRTWEDLKTGNPGQKINHLKAGLDSLGSGLHGLIEGPDAFNLTSAVMFVIEALAHFALEKEQKWRGGV